MIDILSENKVLVKIMDIAHLENGYLVIFLLFLFNNKWTKNRYDTKHFLW